MPRTARIQRIARTWGDIWHVHRGGAMLRNALLDQRVPDDRTHVAWLYGQEDPVWLGAQPHESRWR